MRRRALAAAFAVAIAAFALYRSTLLPGFDLGDTGSFQATVGSSAITPRDGYPLYFAVGDLFLWITGYEPAHALNLASTVEGATACALLALVGAELSGSVAAAAGAALLFAVSYTFWSQSILAEVYSLHLLLVLLCIRLLLWWAERPTNGRLAVFFAVYALGFGNHLSMILLAPGFMLFLFLAAPGGWRSMFAWRVIGIAAVCALLGSLQYAWNLSTLWTLPDPPHSIAAAIEQFWFDVTKADWRETMVMRVPEAAFWNRLAMYWFDVRQQFGWIGPLLAAAGLVQLARTAWRRAALLLVLYLACVTFAFGYNVGDAHVFYLPSHLMLALLAAPGIVLLGNVCRQPTLAAVLLASYASLRAWHDYPALDRSRDNRPAQLLAELTAGLDDHHAILITDLNWQLENGLSYFAEHDHPAVAYARMPAVALYVPELVANNTAVDRDVVLTEAANHTLTDAYGPLFRTERDSRVAVHSLSAVAARLPPGARYALCILKPTRELALDWNDLGQALAILAGQPVHVPNGDYVAIAGLAGQPPVLLAGTNRPGRWTLVLDDVAVEIRMESWLAADTIRRMGFGHVIAARRHTLIVERGASMAAFDRAGEPIVTAYASNIFAPQARYLIRR